MWLGLSRPIMCKSEIGCMSRRSEPMTLRKPFSVWWHRFWTLCSPRARPILYISVGTRLNTTLDRYTKPLGRWPSLPFSNRASSLISIVFVGRCFCELEGVSRHEYIIRPNCLQLQCEGRMVTRQIEMEE